MSEATPVVRLENLRKVYVMGDQETVALDGVDLTLDHGEFVAVMGASGSGKSTLLHVIGLLDRPTSGRYFFEGADVAQLDGDHLADLRSRRLGFVFQSYNLLARTTAVENVELPLVYAGVGGKERRRRAVAALEQVGLGNRLEHNPNQLSGGQQQRVAIARAIVNRPKVILADEPTGALDSRTSVEVMAVFQELGRAGITIVLVTHEQDVAEFASRVVMMRDGHILSDKRQEAKLAVAGSVALDIPRPPGAAA